MKISLKEILLCLVFFIPCQTTYAEDPPDHTYMWSDKDPTLAFNNGVIADGTDYNLLEFISGNSVARLTAGYIGTIDNQSLVLNRLERALQHRSGNQPSQYWVYPIRPSLTFYNVINSLHYSAQLMRNQNPALFQRLEEVEAMLRSFHFNMWVARGMILPSQIESATLYRLVDNQLTAIVTRQNPNYIPMAPIVSPDYIAVTGSTDQYIFYSDLGTFHILPGAFCQSFFSGIGLLYNSAGYGVCIQHTYADLEAKLRRNIVLISD